MERTVIIGGGEAGLIAAAYLERADETDVLLVSEREYHVFSFLLYDVIAGTPFSRACLDLPSTFRKKDVTFVQGLVEGLAATENRIDLRSGSLHFDTLLITVGGVTNYDIDDRGHVFDIRTNVREIRSAVNSPDVCDVVVVGGGPVGVETAATLSSLDDTEVTMVTSSHRLLPDFPPRASRIAERELHQQGVGFKTETRVTEVTENGVVLGGDGLEMSDLTVWAGGVRPNPVIESFGLQRNERGLCVDSHLRCLDVDDVYAAGDVVDYPGKVKDGYSAGLEARTAANNVLRGLRGQRLVERDVRWHPRVVYLGERNALLSVNGMVHFGRGPALMRAVAVKGYPFYWKRVY
ncbi:NAD(P)/FAD-dependent oxidoreductase [Halomicrococcus sp. NG-SE-24]|uniref:NAD(P)/FAD-dependent oxidoreductase n=1 Tax=Halomicrococcus sp. NG-SE-24 TaxID=3436928 RepID=UPI003D98DEDE